MTDSYRTRPLNDADRIALGRRIVARYGSFHALMLVRLWDDDSDYRPMIEALNDRGIQAAIPADKRRVFCVDKRQWEILEAPLNDVDNIGICEAIRRAVEEVKQNAANYG